MKNIKQKLSLFLAIIIILTAISTVTVSAAKPGDPRGDVLYSDITAYINGNAIPTSVIQGKTLVAVEDLTNYGFDVKWDGVAKTLKVEFNKNKNFTPLPVIKDTANTPGAFKCKYFYTEIKTYLSGELVESFAIDGKTLINFDLLKKYGKMDWDGVAREIKLTINRSVPVETPKEPITKEPELVKKELSYGDKFVFDDLEITFLPNYEWDVVSNKYSEYYNKKVIKFPVTIKNVKSETHSLGSWYYNFYNPAGNQAKDVGNYFNDDYRKSGSMRSGAMQNAYMHVLYESEGNYYIEFSKFGNGKVEIKLPVKEKVTTKAPTASEPTTENTIQSPTTTTEKSNSKYVFALTDDEIRQAIKDGEAGNSVFTKNIMDKYTIKPTKNTIMASFNDVYLATPYYKIALSSNLASSDYNSYSFKDAKEEYNNNEYSGNIDFVFTLYEFYYENKTDYIIEIFQGNKKIKAVFAGDSGFPRRSAFWPEDPAYTRTVAARIKQSDIDINKPIIIKFQYGEEIVYEVDLRNYK